MILINFVFSLLEWKIENISIREHTTGFDRFSSLGTMGYSKIAKNEKIEKSLRTLEDMCVYVIFSYGG